MDQSEFPGGAELTEGIHVGRIDYIGLHDVGWTVQRWLSSHWRHCSAHGTGMPQELPHDAKGLEDSGRAIGLQSL